MSDLRVNKLIYIFTFGFLSFLLPAQGQMTLEEAIQMGLKRNYAVQIYKNQNEISKLQNNLGSAGMTPQLSLLGTGNVANINSSQQFNNGTTQEISNAQSFGLQGALNLNMNIYDGNKMFAIKKRLEQNEQLSAIELKRQMENTISDIIIAYYNIVRINELIKSENQNLLIYQERKKIAKLKLEIGSDSKVDFLLAQSDENRAKSILVQMDLQLLDAKIKLNTIIGISADTDYQTSDSITVNYNPTIEDLKKDLAKKNSTILIAKQNERISAQSVKESRAAMLPLVNLNLDYRYNRSQSQAGFLFSNNQNGLYGQVTAAWVLFSGNKNRNFLRERNIQLLDQKLIVAQTELEVDALVYINYKRFLLSKQIAELEFLNLKDSQELQVISTERYRVGKSGLLETIEAQKNLEDAQYRYINALYSIKLAETELLRVNGDLVK